MIPDTVFQLEIIKKYVEEIPQRRRSSRIDDCRGGEEWKKLGGRQKWRSRRHLGEWRRRKEIM